MPPCLPDNESVRSDICDYYLTTQMFDHECGEAIAALENTGELDNTLDAQWANGPSANSMTLVKIPSD